ncbi:carbohydrate-binding module family 1 protein [Aplosporella prunicola CBS 121167]|uniref:lytic cellulose monooxygenase (C4-dehydrogenating) n=1 Tax=Aplosporella prunicola CBS 121167 TaxID=1176127 RepID=A0A6A6BNE4_9PEZI|nr:carbohydrate-binding module family 1 protein [Aplosporella prunicola CBS 121167]KAF2145669.1 carbohydrate-binding module family 1 protein [Aplosporella prunicola CBS 121167]
MKFTLSTMLAAATLVPSISAHYCFNRLIVNDKYTTEYEYVRKNDNSNSPITDVTSNDLRCNSGGLDTGKSTKTYEVKAGDKVGFALDTGIGHPGPVQVYMSKADTTAAAYDGSGDWFKVYELGTKEITDEGLQWATANMQNFTFTLPEKVPAGEYLLRAESIALHGAQEVGGAQFYISCAQIKVTSDSTATPDPTVKIPGVYTGKEPGIQINIYYPIPTSYTFPGPKVWPSGASNEEAVASAGASTPAASAAATSSVAAVNNIVSTPAAASTPAAVSTPAVVSSPAAASSPAATPSTLVTKASSYAPISTPTPGNSSGTAKKYGQCGGRNWNGATTCPEGTTCKVQNDFYSQCT